jgi:hypothetical protein
MTTPKWQLKPNGRPMVDRPIRLIGNFFTDLKGPDRTAALRLARNAHRMAKVDINREFWRLANAANYIVRGCA